jgi:hypothetical protein
MLNLEIENQKLLDAYLAATTDRNAALNAWSDAPHADKKKFIPVLEAANLRLAVAYAALQKYWPEKTFSHAHI